MHACGHVVVAWLSGNALVSINVVALRRVQLIPGWGLSTSVSTISVCNQPYRSTQPSTLCGMSWVE